MTISKLSSYLSSLPDLCVQWFIRFVYAIRLDGIVFSPWLCLGAPSDADLARKYTKAHAVSGGLAGTVTRLQLDLIVKRPRANTAEARLSCRQTGQWREARFLSDVGMRRKLQAVLPVVYETWHSQVLGDFMVATERVDGDMLKWYLGNQRNVNGLPSGKRRFFLSEMETKVGSTKVADHLLEDLFKRAAEMHAVHWNDRTLLKRTWLKGTTWYEGKGKEQYDQMIGWASSLYASGLKSRPAGLISEPLHDRIIEALKAASFDEIVAHLNDPMTPLCLHHGDFHAGNIMIRKAEGDDDVQFVFLDFSEVGVFDPMFDLCQILISDVEGSEYERICKPLVRAWYTRLRQVTDASEDDDPLQRGFSVEVAYRSMLAAGVQRWIYLLAALTGFMQVSNEAIAYFAYNLQCWIDLFEKVVPKKERTIRFLKV